MFWEIPLRCRVSLENRLSLCWYRTDGCPGEGWKHWSSAGFAFGTSIPPASGPTAYLRLPEFVGYPYVLISVWFIFGNRTALFQSWILVWWISAAVPGRIYTFWNGWWVWVFLLLELAGHVGMLFWMQLGKQCCCKAWSSSIAKWD